MYKIIHVTHVLTDISLDGFSINDFLLSAFDSIGVVSFGILFSSRLKDRKNDLLVLSKVASSVMIDFDIIEGSHLNLAKKGEARAKYLLKKRAAQK